MKYTLLVLLAIGFTGCAHGQMMSYDHGSVKVTCNDYCDEEDWKEIAYEACHSNHINLVGIGTDSEVIGSSGDYGGGSFSSTVNRQYIHYRIYECGKKKAKTTVTAHRPEKVKESKFVVELADTGSDQNLPDSETSRPTE